MTNYSPSDLAENWEFKILRANTRVFRNPERLRSVLEEEKRGGGWVLVEKFDDTRIRLKRRAGVKAVEEEISTRVGAYDPYRTELGMSQGMQAILIVLPLLVLSGMLLLMGLLAH